jgi:hypothetical protein
MENRRRGPEFESISGNRDCEARHCPREAKYVAKWPFVVKRVCSSHMAEVDGKPWYEAQPNFGTSIPPR